MRTDTRTLEDRIADRDAKLDAMHAKLTGAVEALVTGEDWRRALEFAARFRARSFNNTLLIWVQHTAACAEGRVPDPYPTFVAGFKQWQALGRHVMKGQPGYQIFSPVTARMASDKPDDPTSWRRLGRGERPAPGETVRSRMIRVRPAYVWAQSQTDGKPLPEQPTPKLLEGEAPAGLWDGLADQITAHGFEMRLVSNATAIGGANGLTDYLTREVSVRMDMDDAAQVKTLAHELGHVILHGPDNTDAAMHRGLTEIEAESVALMLLAAHNMDSTHYTVPYVSTWASRIDGVDPVTAVQQTAARVRTAALGILDKLDTQTLPDGDPSGLDRTATRNAPPAAAPTSLAKPTPHAIEGPSL
jgi:hypothetical protein